MRTSILTTCQAANLLRRIGENLHRGQIDFSHSANGVFSDRAPLRYKGPDLTSSFSSQSTGRLSGGPLTQRPRTIAIVTDCHKPVCFVPAPHRQSGLKSHTSQASVDLAVHSPESVGFSSERLERLHSAMQKTIDNKQIAGMVTLLARHGKIVDFRAYGVRDIASGAPMTKDTIFRDYSMTKPVTGVAMMILYEEGKWLPSEPIAKYVPEFAHLKVFKGVDGDGKMILVDPDHPPTMHELMSHTAGFTYGFFGDTPVDQWCATPTSSVQGSAGVYRQAAKFHFSTSRAGVDLFGIHGHRGLSRRKALRQVAARFHARPHLPATRDARCRLLRTGREAQPLRDPLLLEVRGRRTNNRSAAGRGQPARLRQAAGPCHQGRRHGVYHRRLLPLRADDGQRRRTRG